MYEGGGARAVEGGWEGSAAGPTPKAGAPRILPIDPDVELRDVAVLARVGLRDPRDRLDRLQRPLGGDLQARRLRPLHVDDDRLLSAAEDRRLPHDLRAHAGNRAKLLPEVGLDGEQRPLVAVLERHEDVSLIGRPA